MTGPGFAQIEAIEDGVARQQSYWISPAHYLISAFAGFPTSLVDPWHDIEFEFLKQHLLSVSFLNFSKNL